MKALLLVPLALVLISASSCSSKKFFSKDFNEMIYSTERDSTYEFVPVAAGCEKLGTATAEVYNSCFTKYISQHLEQNFEYPTETNERKLEVRVYVNFTIEKDGSISNVKVIT